MTLNTDNRKKNSVQRTALIIAGSSELGVNIINHLITQYDEITFTWWKNNSQSRELQQKYCDCIKSLQLDLSCEESVMQFCSQISNQYFNTVIYCAGVNPAILCDQIDPVYLKKINWVNLISAMMIFNTVVKKMKAHKDAETKLIYISSVAAHKVSVGNSLYGATKIAMERYMSSVALEMARFNIRTLCLSPGYIKTKMLDEYCSDRGITLQDIEKSIPMRKMLVPHDIVRTVAAFINNDIITTGVTLTLGHGERFI